MRPPREEHDRFLHIFPDFGSKHPELDWLSDAEFVAWFRILLGQLRYGYTYAELHPNGTTSKRHLNRFLELGLLEEKGGHLFIVDWEGWNGRRDYKRLLNRERQQRFRDRRKLSDETR